MDNALVERVGAAMMRGPAGRRLTEQFTDAEIAAFATAALNASGIDGLVEALEPFALAFDSKVQDARKAQSRRDWNEQMPGHWPIELTVTMDDGRRARTALSTHRGTGG